MRQFYFIILLIIFSCSAEAQISIAIAKDTHHSVLDYKVEWGYGYSSENTVQASEYLKLKGYTQKDIYDHWLKEKLELHEPASWFPMALSIIGDTGDGFKGVMGIGQKTLPGLFEYIMTLCGRSMNNVYENIAAKKPIFNTSYNVNNNALKKIIDNQDVIVRNLKLSSFKILSDCVNSGFPLDMGDKKKQILESVSNTYKCSSAGIMVNALNKAGLMGVVTENTVSNLF